MATPRKIPAIIETIIQHTENVKSFIMTPKKPIPRFKPGQFLHLALDPYDPSFNWPESRVFSIANSPTRNREIRITFAIKGNFTKRMFDEVKESDNVWLKLPFGSFTLPDKDNPVILIAGGTGITPFVSFLEYALDKQLNNTIDLWYGVRSSKHIIFDTLLTECQKKLPNFHLHLSLEDFIKLDHFRDIKEGMLSIESIYEQIEAEKGPVFYLSGPPQMIQIFQKALYQKGIKEGNIKVDAWE